MANGKHFGEGLISDEEAEKIIMGVDSHDDVKVRPSLSEVTKIARRVAAEHGVSNVKFVVVCPEHGATGPFDTEEEAVGAADYLNRDGGGSGCVYRALPFFTR